MIRRLAVVATLVGGAVAALPAAPAQAVAACRVDNECVTSYYSDISHTQIVGQITVFCDGSRDEWGTFGRYPVVQNVPCG
ncbi:MAG: hypothetical protein HOV83_31065 [Catenulispora sp.]|nr:hypothetical protein [Catenulispora sp.]